MKTYIQHKAQLLIVGLCLLTSGLLSAQTITLDSCLALARRNNVDIRTSKIELEQAREVKKQVFTKYFPQVQLSGLGYISAQPLMRFGIDDVQSSDMREILNDLYELVDSTTDVKREFDLMKRGLSGSVMVAQPLYAGGRIITGNRLASLGVEAAELKSQMQIRDILENIESTFYLVVGLQQKVATVTSALELIDSLDHIVQNALHNGLVTRTDALQVQLKRNEITAMSQQLTSGIRLSKRLLCAQIGLTYNESLQFVDLDAEVAPECTFTLSPTASPNRPEIRLLQMGVEAERLNKRLTLGEALPQLSIIGTAYYGNIVKQKADANMLAMISLSVPLSAWWETSHKLRQHNLRIVEAELKQQHLSQMMSIEEEKAYSDMVDARLLMKSDSAALDIADENYRLATLNYSAGVTTLTEVLQAQTLLLQAQNAITDRRTTYIMARRRLLDLQKPITE